MSTVLEDGAGGVSRRRFMGTTVRGLAALTLSAAVAGRAQAGTRAWSVGIAILAILRNSANYARWDGTANYLVWGDGGKRLDAAIRAFKGTPNGGLYNQASEFVLGGGKPSAARVPDGQCVGLIRAATKIGATSTWRRGRNVLTPGPNQSLAPDGTVIARFTEVSPGVWRYTDRHVAILAGYRSSAAGGGLSIWDQNVSGEFVTWRSLPVTNRAGVLNPAEYYVVETET